MLRVAFAPALALAGALTLAGQGGAGAPALRGSRPDPAPVRPRAVSARPPAPKPPPLLSPPPSPSRARPVRLRVPAIDVSAPVIALGLRPDGSIDVPSTRRETSWFEPGSAPGEAGPAVVAGHVSLAKGPAVFARLHRLRPGDVVEVDRADGLTARFAVSRVERHPKDAFPTEAVYGPTDAPELRLITCGGELDRSTGSFRDNVVVFADFLGAG